MTLEELEKRIRLLESINNGALPLSAAGAAISAVSFAPVLMPFLFVGAAASGFLGVSMSRNYAKKQRSEMLAALERFRANGEIGETKYRKLLIALNKLTTDS